MYLPADRNMRYLWILTAVLIALGFFRLAFCRPALPSPGGVDAVLQGTSALYAALLMLNRSRRDESGGKWLLLGLGCLANFVVPYVPLAAPVVTNDFLADSGITGTLVALEQIFFLLAVHMMLRRAGLDGVRDYLDIMIYTVVIVSLCGFARMGSSTADLSIPHAMIELMGVAVSTATMVGLVMLLSHEEGCGGRSTLLILAGFAALTAAFPLSLEWQLIGNGSRVSDRWTEFLQFAGMMLLGMAALFDGDRRRFVGRSGERAARSQWKVPWPMIGVISLMALLLATENRSLPVIGTAAVMLLRMMEYGD